MNIGIKFAAAALAGALATVAAGGIAMATTGRPGMAIGPMAKADANGDGQVTRAEWMQAATARFAKLDANKDGTLSAGEMPRRHHRHGHRHGPDRDGPPPSDNAAS